jgi:hypothetical protein
MRYSDHEQRQMDIASGEELDRHAERQEARAERLEKALREIMLRTSAYKDDESWPLVSGVYAVAEKAVAR